MKRIFLSSPFLLIACLSQAQITKGTVMLGGDATVYSQSSSGTAYNPATTKETNFSIDPSMGLAVANNLVLGLDLGAGYSSTSNNNGQKSDSYQAGVFLRKYKPLGDKFYFFTETELQYVYFDQTTDVTADTRQDMRNSSVNLSLAPGVAYSLNRRWQLEVEFPNVVEASYGHEKDVYNIPTQGASTQSETQELYHSFNFSTDLSTGFQLLVGVRYLIGS